MLHQMTLQQKQQQIQQVQNCVKLPKLEIIGYNGDKQKLKEFWDQFECTVRRNTKLSDIEKFSYLKGKLHGQAQSAISGLTLSNENDEVAVDILKERFGDVQTAVNTHYVELINLPQVTNFRMIYDKIEQNLRSLEAL